MWAFLIVLLLGAALLQRHSLRHSLDNVGFDTGVSQIAVDPDEDFEIVSVLSNGGRMPVFFLRVQELWPADIAVLGEGLDLRADRDMTRLNYSCYLWPRQRLERRVRASLPRRGRYFLRGANLSGGDFIGMAETHEHVALMREIVVMPRPAAAPGLPETLGGYLGMRSVNRFVMEDPVLTLGFREYTGREPQKAISWPVSARSGRLMVKKYDYTLEQSVTVLLNVECGDESAGPDAARIEACFSLARSVCEELEEKGVQYSFLTNATAAGAVGLWSDIYDGLGQSHLYAILEGLGRATYGRAEPFAETLERAARRAAQGRCHVLITPCDAGLYAHALSLLRELSGQEILTLYPPPEVGAEEEEADA